MAFLLGDHADYTPRIPVFSIAASAIALPMRAMFLNITMAARGTAVPPPSATVASRIHEIHESVYRFYFFSGLKKSDAGVVVAVYVATDSTGIIAQAGGAD